jgi:hypothetical protein
MTKDELEQRLNRAGLKAERKAAHRGGELFIAEGFFRDPPPGASAVSWLVDHPAGYYQTVWFWAKGEDKLMYGPVLVFDALHDVERLALGDRQRARLNATEQHARQFLDDMLLLEEEPLGAA